MGQMENAILNQLIWIKWLLAIIVVAFVLCALGVVLLAKVFSKLPEQMRNEGSFSDRARILLDQGKYQELINFSEKRISGFPADAHAHWYLGQACYRVGDLRRALVCLRRTQELQPDWESSYTGPLIRAIEEKFAQGATKADLKVITTNISIDKGASPDDRSPINT